MKIRHRVVVGVAVVGCGMALLNGLSSCSLDDFNVGGSSEKDQFVSKCQDARKYWAGNDSETKSLDVIDTTEEGKKSSFVATGRVYSKSTGDYLGRLNCTLGHENGTGEEIFRGKVYTNWD